MPNMPVVTAKALLEYLLKYGCTLTSVKGSHFKVENTKNGRRAPIPVHGKRDISSSFSKSILNQLGIDIDDFIEFISKN